MTDTLLAFFKALADESRLRIVGLLGAGERNVQELARALDLKEPTVSHHLAILKRSGLVTARADGTTRWHALDRGALENLAQRVLQPQKIAVAEPESADAWDARVLAGYVTKDGRLKSIPASRKKRGAVLRWLMRDFESGRRYPEAKVNAAIEAHHWDCATLRRELVGHRMMARENRIYWRLPESEWRKGGEA
jgi:hypothetical protein